MLIVRICIYKSNSKCIFIALILKIITFDNETNKIKAC